MIHAEQLQPNSVPRSPNREIPMRLILNYAAGVLLALVLVSGQLNAQDQRSSSPEEGASSEESPVPEGSQQGASSMTEEQQSAAKKSFCSALAGQHKDAATTGVSALTDPKVLLNAATNYSSAMHVPVSSATSLLKGFAQQHASDILSSCAVSNATGAASSVLPGALSSGVPGIGGVPQIPAR
jgi:hypothetical protein